MTEKDFKERIDQLTGMLLDTVSINNGLLVRLAMWHPLRKQLGWRIDYDKANHPALVDAAGIARVEPRRSRASRNHNFGQEFAFRYGGKVYPFSPAIPLLLKGVNEQAVREHGDAAYPGEHTFGPFRAEKKYQIGLAIRTVLQHNKFRAYPLHDELELVRWGAHRTNKLYDELGPNLEGLQSITIDQSDQFPHTMCIKVHATKAGRPHPFEISWKSVQNGQTESRRNAVVAVMRMLIEPQIVQFRRMVEAAGTYRCEDSGVLITPGVEWEVDHDQHNLSFVDLAGDFLSTWNEVNSTNAMAELVLDDLSDIDDLIAADSVDPWGYGSSKVRVRHGRNSFDDPEMEEAWIEFHCVNARLIPLTKEAHRKRRAK